MQIKDFRYQWWLQNAANTLHMRDSMSNMLHMPRAQDFSSQMQEIARKIEIAPEVFASRKLTVVFFFAICCAVKSLALAA